MGGSSNTTSTTTSGASKNIQKMSDANALAASKVAPTKVFDDARVAAQSGQTSGGLSALTGIANNNMGGAGLSGQLQSVIDSGGYNAAQQNALQNFQSVANSKFDLNSDPAWAQIRDATISGVNLGAAGAGRYGSGSNTDMLASSLADAGARQYSNWQSRADAANANLANLGATGFGQLGQAYTGMQAPANTLLGVGSQQDAYQQSLINSNIDKFNETQQAPRSDIAWLQGILGGAGQLNTTTTQKAPGQSNLMTGLGYAASGAGLLGGFF